jgi:DNA-directed RNA polymerase subunit E'/Rpb7
VEIPAHELMQPAFFDARSKLWMWQHQEDQLFSYDLGSEILFKVKSVSLGSEISLGDKRLAITHRPSSSSVAPGGSSAPVPMATGNENECSVRPLQPPMLVIGTVNESGLGPLVWWGELPC